MIEPTTQAGAVTELGVGRAIGPAARTGVAIAPRRSVSGPAIGFAIGLAIWTGPYIGPAIQAGADVEPGAGRAIGPAARTGAGIAPRRSVGGSAIGLAIGWGRARWG